MLLNLLTSAGAIVAKVLSEHRTMADFMIRISLFVIVSVNRNNNKRTCAEEKNLCRGEGSVQSFGRATRSSEPMAKV